MATIYEVAAAGLKAAVSRGFDAPTWETIPGKAMFAATELNELHVEMRIGPGSAATLAELADCALRVMAILEAVWPGEWCDRTASAAVPPGALSPYDRPAELLWPTLRRLALACQCWRHDGQQDRVDTRINLEFALRELEVLRATLYSPHLPPQSLAQLCEAKMAANASRPRRHGYARGDC